MNASIQAIAINAIPRNVLPSQVPTNGAGATSELEQLLSSTNNLSTNVVTHATQLQQAQQQQEQQKQLVQQANLLQQQNAIMAQQLLALQQQPTAIPITNPNTTNVLATAPINSVSNSTPASSSITGNKQNAVSSSNTTSTPRKVAETAESLVGLDSKSNAPPETQGGKLACAWFVNEVLKKVYGRTFPKNGDTLSVDGVVSALKAEGATEVSASELKAGDIVYVPGKHIGIIAADGGGSIVHNSSGQRKSVKTDGSTFSSYKGQPHKYLRLA